MPARKQGIVRNSHLSASPDLWGSVLRELLVEVSQCLHDSRRALHVGVVDHDVTCQQGKCISATTPVLGSSRATGCQCPPWPRAHVSHCVPSPGTGRPALLSSPYQTPLRGSAAPVSGLHAWFHMWQSLHLSSSCSATAQRSREREAGSGTQAVPHQSGPKTRVRTKSDS